jgi:hypothetical protein
MPETDNTSPVPTHDRNTATTGPTPGPHYPDAGSYQWGEFACLAIEFGGYGDLSAVDPYDGRRLNTRAFNPGGGSVYDALRRLVDEMQRTRFLDTVLAGAGQAVTRQQDAAPKAE